jgi:glyoxylase-like metal-dependent hydrolase (beta-lactamase superfamily II)
MWIVAVTLAACGQGGDGAAPAPAQAGDAALSGTAQEIVAAAAEALGGQARLDALRTLRLVGYGQYTHQYGGGGISPVDGIPLKLQQANELVRVWDVPNRRYRARERRNYLFPFAAFRGHDFAPLDQVLDGAVAYDVAENGTARRVGPSVGVGADGARERRMWMHANPVLAVLAALDASDLGNARSEDGLDLVDFTLPEGDAMTLAVTRQSGLPAWVRWSGPHANLGQVEYTMHFTGYLPYGGLRLPMGLNASVDWRDVDYLKIYVDTWDVDAEVADMAAPAEVAAAPEPVVTVDTEVTPIARGLWRISGGTMVIEFDDHLTLFELNGSPERAAAVIAVAREIVPGKPVTEVIASHQHFDHTVGLRVAVAEGLTIISRRDNGVIFEEMMSRGAPDFPDALERNPQPFNFIPVDDHLRLEDDTMAVDLYHVIANQHMADAVLAYIPEHRAILEADVATAAEELQWWGNSWQRNIDYRGLDVALNVPVHMEVMTYDEVIEMIQPGIERTYAWCAERTVTFMGCPPQPQ